MATWAEIQKAPKLVERVAEKGENIGRAYQVAHKDYAPDKTGLKLRVFASGRRCWYIRGRINSESGKGKARFIVLGEVPGMTRDEAAVEAAKARQLLRTGIDPIADRDAAMRAAESKSKTFGEVVAEWTADRSPKWRDSTTEARRILFNHKRLKPWQDRPIASITAKEIEAHASTIKQNSQQAALAPVRSVFKYAAEQGYLAESTFTKSKVTVAKAEGNAAPLIALEDGRVPDFSEMVATLDAIDACEQASPLSPWWNIWRVCIFTGQRPSAIIGLRWSELSALDGDAPVWTLPAERSKIKLTSKIPLSKDCAAILQGIPRGDSELVWPGRGGDQPLHYPEGEPKQLSGFLAARGFPVGWKPGRARDSMASWLDFQSDATERTMALILGHKPPAHNTRQKHYGKIGAEHQARTLVERYAAAIRDARAGVQQKVVPLKGR